MSDVAAHVRDRLMLILSTLQPVLLAVVQRLSVSHDIQMV